MQRRSSPIFLNNNSVSEANAQEQLTEADIGPPLVKVLFLITIYHLRNN